METKDTISTKNTLEGAPPNINAMRIGMDENTIMLEFGTITEEDGQKKSFIQSKVQVPAKSLRGVVERIVAAGILYEKKFQTDVGFKEFRKLAKKKKKKKKDEDNETKQVQDHQ